MVCKACFPVTDRGPYQRCQKGSIWKSESIIELSFLTCSCWLFKRDRSPVWLRICQVTKVMPFGWPWFHSWCLLFCRARVVHARKHLVALILIGHKTWMISRDDHLIVLRICTVWTRLWEETFYSVRTYHLSKTIESADFSSSFMLNQEYSEASRNI